MKLLLLFPIFGLVGVLAAATLLQVQAVAIRLGWDIRALLGLAVGLIALAIYSHSVWFSDRRTGPLPIEISTVSKYQFDKFIRYLKIALLGLILAAFNYIVLVLFNTVLWPNLWPQPIIYILIGVFGITMWFPELLKSVWALRGIGVMMIFAGESYLLHALQVSLEQPSPLGIIHLVGTTGMFFTITLNYINQIRPKDHRTAPPLPDDLPSVAVVIPTYGEPLAILRRTVLSISRLDYPADKLYILISDDARRREVKQLADMYGVNYAFGPRKDAKAGNLNSALEHISEHFPQATLVLTQDADEIVARSFLKKTVGYFTDPCIAFVQTTKEVFAPPGDPFGTRDRLFYDVLQPGRNGFNAAFACGSGVVWHIDAVKSVGGFSNWNIVEDLTTSYLLHTAGYSSEYHNEILSIGLAPNDIPNLLKQRGTWAADTWRLFLYDNPVFNNKLSLPQRMQYLELGAFYLTALLFTPLLMLVPLISLATGEYLPIEGSALFPWVTVIILYYIILARGRGLILLRHWQYWVGHCPTYIKGFLLALGSRDRKPEYVVTRKTRQRGLYVYLLWVQFLYLAIGAGVIVRAMLHMPEADLYARFTNSAIVTFFMFMVSGICMAAFYNVDLPSPRNFNPLAAWQQLRNQPAFARLIPLGVLLVVMSVMIGVSLAAS